MSSGSGGDPSGKKLARQRALRLAEAGRVARALEVLLKRAEFDFSPCTNLITKIAEQERTWLGRSGGRVEPRRRLKGHSGQPILENRPTSILCIDESGQSKREELHPPAPTFFALSAIAIPQESVEDYCNRANTLKQAFFGTTDLTFHEPYMRNRVDPYYFAGDTDKQRDFDRAVNQLIEQTDFTVFGVGVRKLAFERDFLDAGIDPYLPTDAYSLAILMLLERYVDFLHADGTKRFGRVIFESQGPLEDAIHQLDYARVLLDGSQWIHSSAFRNWLEPGLRFQPKCGSHPMEISDMFARDLFEWIRSDCTSVPKRWELFSRRIYCRDSGLSGTFGVKIFPDTDIRDRVLEHRERCGATLKN